MYLDIKIVNIKSHGKAGGGAQPAPDVHGRCDGRPGAFTGRWDGRPGTFTGRWDGRPGTFTEGGTAAR
jgi:hypothetical protein